MQVPLVPLLIMVAAAIKTAHGQALLDAVKVGDLTDAERLLQSGEYVNEYGLLGDFPLWWAAQRGQADMLKLLLGHGADVTQTPKTKEHCGRTPLMVASSAEVARLLLEAGANDTATDCFGDTAVHLAAFFGHLEVLMYLLNATSIGIEMKGDADFTPLHNAVHEGHSDVAQYLVDAGANVEARKMPESWTPLMIAAIQNTEGDVIKVLAKAGAKVDAVDAEGKTAVWLAAAANRAGGYNVIVALVEAGADVNKKEVNGYTPLDGATAVKNSQAEKVLKVHGGTSTIDLNYGYSGGGGRTNLSVKGIVKLVGIGIAVVIALGSVVVGCYKKAKRDRGGSSGGESRERSGAGMQQGGGAYAGVYGTGGVAGGQVNAIAMDDYGRYYGGGRAGSGNSTGPGPRGPRY